MYYIKNKSEYFYVFDKYKGKYTYFQNKNELIDWILKCCIKKSFFSDKEIIDFTNIDFSGTDTQVTYTYTKYQYIYNYYCRNYIVMDGDFRIVDIRLFKEEICAAWEQNFLERQKKLKLREKGIWDWTPTNNNYVYGDLLVRKGYYNNHYYRYRMDSVPRTRKVRGGPRQYKKYGKLIRMVNHPDYKKYNRVGLYSDLKVNGWWSDECNIRCCTKSWKDKKIKKQWQKNL